MKGTPAEPAPGTAITLDTTVMALSGSTTTARYDFTLANAGRVYLEIKNYFTGGLWTLTGPRGVEVSSAQLAGSISFNTVLDPQRFLDLIAGNYTLTISSPTSIPGTVQFSFRLDNLTAAVTPITANQTNTITSQTGISARFFTFDATAGDHVYFDALTYAPGFPATDAKWTLFDPYGRQLSVSSLTMD